MAQQVKSSSLQVERRENRRRERRERRGEDRLTGSLEKVSHLTAMAYVASELVSHIIKEIAALLIKEAFKATISLMSSVDETIFMQVKTRITKIKNDLEYFKPFLSKISQNGSQSAIQKTWSEKVLATAQDAQNVIHEISEFEDIVEKSNSFVASLLESVNKRAATQMWKKMDDKLKVIESKLDEAHATKERYKEEFGAGQSSSHYAHCHDVQVPMLTGVDHEGDTDSNPPNFESNSDALEFGPKKRQRIVQLLRDAGLSKKARSALLGSLATNICTGSMCNSTLEHQIPEDMEVKLSLDSLKRVMNYMRRVGLKSSKLIIGIDFTNSNESSGECFFNGQNLHTIGGVQNPYEQVISIIGEAFSPFHKDNFIHTFGFGNGSTRDHDVFRLYPDRRPCKDIEDVLERYRELVQDVRLAGPTSFAPIIEMAITSVLRSAECSFSILLIITDGQVTRRPDTRNDELSQQERNTIDAIFRASQCPLSIIMVGVGDGPWDASHEMHQLQKKIPPRSFDNFEFVNFTEIMSKEFPLERRLKEFAEMVLMAATQQYESVLNLGMLRQKLPEMDVPVPARVPLPPPSGEKVQNGMAVKGFESSNLIVGIDFTMSNEWAGLHSFNHQSLHSLVETPNPYEQVISIVGQKLSPFCQNNNIQCFGFGDRSTRDEDVFSFGGPCNGIADILQRYRKLVPHVHQSGPKCFGPIIEMSMSSIVRSSGYPNTFLLIITNRQIAWGTNTRECGPSQQERNTIDSIVRASRYPLSIIMVGVGDGPWDAINQFKDKIPSCPFDNFKFVNFTETKQNEFAQMVEMGATASYKALHNLGILRREPPELDIPERLALPPPHREKILLSSSRDVCSSKTSLFVSDAMAELGLEHLNLMMGIDFSKSNEATGHHSFNGRNLHASGDAKNPYEQVISTVGEALSPFYDLIHCFGFGDESTLDKEVFSFYPNEGPCSDLKDALQRYRVLVPHVVLSEKSPKSFAPLIEMATFKVVHDLNDSYSLLLIITDGQVSRNVKKTIDAIVRASHYPLSIVMIGVGDGPWDKMHQFMKKIPSRPFRNFQFVNFTEIMSDGIFSENLEEFALKVVLGAIAEFKAVNRSGHFGKMKEEIDRLKRTPIPPPVASVNGRRT